MSYDQNQRRQDSAGKASHFFDALSSSEFSSDGPHSLRINADSIPAMLAFVDRNERVLYANRCCEQLYRLPTNEIVGRHLNELLDEEAYQATAPYLLKVLNGQAAHFSFCQVTSTGRQWVDAHLVPGHACAAISNDGSKSLAENLNQIPAAIEGFYAYFTDITEQVKTRHELEREIDLFEGVVEGVPDSLMLADLNRTITFCNRGTKQVFGYEPHELRGQSTLILYDAPDEHQKQGRVRFRPDADPELEPIELMMRRKSGEAFPAEMVGTILKSHTGEPLGFLGLIRDITKRRESESAKQRHFRVLDALSTGTPLDDLLKLVVVAAEETRPGMLGSILLLDDSKQTLQAGYAASLPTAYNDAIHGLKIGAGVGSCGTAAFTRERVIVEEIATHPYWSGYRDLAESMNLRACWSEPIFSPDDEILGTLAMYFGEPRTPSESDLDLLRQSAQLAGIAIDRARTGLRVRQSEERYRSLVETSSSVVWTTSPEGTFITRQDAWEKYTEQPWEQHQGMGWLDMIHPQDQQRLIGIWRDAVDRGVSYRTQARLWHAASRQYRYIEAHAVPIRDPQGRIVEWVGTTTDVSDRRALEKQVLETASETQRAIGHNLHDGVGQELTGLAMLADSLTEALRRESHDGHALAEKIGVGIERTLDQVRNLARGMNPVVVDPQGLSSALVELAEHVSQLYEIECTISYANGLVVTDSETATQLFRIAQEAITNAVKHGAATRIAVALLKHEDFIELSITDNGSGISKVQFRKGTGMRSMDYRADVVGGNLKISTGRPRGTVVSCRLPAGNMSGESTTGIEDSSG